jgi:hypothetical protein
MVLLRPEKIERTIPLEISIDSDSEPYAQTRVCKWWLGFLIIIINLTLLTRYSVSSHLFPR